MPGNAIMFINDETKTFTAPFCVKENKAFRASSYAEVEKLNYKHQECEEGNLFLEEGRSIPGILFEYVGILKPLPSRWNKDGTWNW
jgi:hypothetical protein